MSIVCGWEHILTATKSYAALPPAGMHCCCYCPVPQPQQQSSPPAKPKSACQHRQCRWQRLEPPWCCWVPRQQAPSCLSRPHTHHQAPSALAGRYSSSGSSSRRAADVVQQPAAIRAQDLCLQDSRPGILGSEARGSRGASNTVKLAAGAIPAGSRWRLSSSGGIGGELWGPGR